MSDRGRTPGRAVRASLVLSGCLLRGMPLFFRATPKTPLRALGIVALDALHVLRHSRPMPRRRIRELALFLDFAACTNAAWDHKNLCPAEYQAIRQQLESAGWGACVEEYLRRLRELESRRPRVGGDRRRFDDVRAYREAVARLALAAAVAIALNTEGLDSGLRATRYDCDVDTLFRILMQCQIIDDVVDYPADLSAGLPSFLTAAAALPQAMELTAGAARSYAARRESASDAIALPLRIALRVFTAAALLLIRVTTDRMTLMKG